MLPAGEVYFRPLMSSKSHRKPGVELTFYSGLQFFRFSSSSFTKYAEFVFTWESWFPPLGQSYFNEPSACLLSVTLEIKFRGKRGVGMRTMGAEMSSRVSSYLV